MCAIFAQDGVYLRPVCTPSCQMTEPIFSRVFFLLVDVRINHGGRGACGRRREEKFGKNRS